MVVLPRVIVVLCLSIPLCLRWRNGDLCVHHLPEGKQYPFHKKPSRRIETVMLHHVSEQTQAKKKGRLLK